MNDEKEGMRGTCQKDKIRQIRSGSSLEFNAKRRAPISTNRKFENENQFWEIFKTAYSREIVPLKIPLEDQEIYCINRDCSE